MAKSQFAQLERAELQGHAENFVRLILHFHPECTGSIRTGKASAMTQFIVRLLRHDIR
jgi:hypothetical protein